MRSLTRAITTFAVAIAHQRSNISFTTALQIKSANKSPTASEAAHNTMIKSTQNLEELRRSSKLRGLNLSDEQLGRIANSYDDFGDSEESEEAEAEEFTNISEKRMPVHLASEFQPAAKKRVLTALKSESQPARPQAPRPPLDETKKILLVGDSQTAQGESEKFVGWVQRLRYRFIGRADVVNRGLSGYTTDMALQQNVIEKAINSELSTGDDKFLFATLMFGGNDGLAANNVPLDKFCRNLVTMGRQLLKRTDLLILMGSQAYVPDEFGSSKEGGPAYRYASGYDFETMRAYAGASKRAAEDLNKEAAEAGKQVVFLELFDGDLNPSVILEKFKEFLGVSTEVKDNFEAEVKDFFQRYYSDGLHYGEVGQAILFDKLWKIVTEEGYGVAKDTSKANKGYNHRLATPGPKLVEAYTGSKMKTEESACNIEGKCGRNIAAYPYALNLSDIAKELEAEELKAKYTDINML